MFKLISLSSPSGLFREIIFHDGLNIILGVYTHDKNDVNGIGKSTVVSLIDFCLLADGPKAKFFSDKYLFLKKESICLEFIVGKSNYKIRRGFESKRVVFLQKDNGEYIEYLDSELRIILSKITLSGDNYRGVFDLAWFRRVMNFFVQDDHSFLARDSNNVIKYVSGSQRKSELLTYNLYLLGLDNNSIWEFDENRVDLKQLQSDQTRIRKQITDKTGSSIESFRAQIDSIDVKVNDFERSLKDFSFEKNYSGLESEISELSCEISGLNKEHLHINRKLSDVKESLNIDIDVDVEKIEDLYREISQQFSSFIKKELSDVLDFRSDISENRSVFLKSREKKYIEKASSIKGKAVSLESRRSELYKRLEEQSAFDAIKSSYQNLLEEKSELDSRRGYLEQLDLVEESIATKKSTIGNIVAEIVKEKSSLMSDLEGIKKIFIEIVENSVDTQGAEIKPYFNIEPRTNIASPLQVNIEVPRGDSLGKGRFKILSYDLTLFLNACENERFLPRFLVHDGVFHGIAHKTRIKFLNYLDKKLAEIGDVQYIITLNEDEIIVPEAEEESVAILDFSLEDRAIIRLEDSPEKMLFSREFG